MNRAFVLGLVSAALVATPALADNAKPSFKLMVKQVPGENPKALPAGALGGQVIFLNRCVGGCTVKPGTDNASTDTSIVPQQQSLLAEYTDFTGTEWEDTVQCVKEIYSPFNVTVTDVRPTGTATYEQIMVAGKPQDLGLPNGVGGIGSLMPGCAPNPKGMAFAFTSAIDVFAQEAGGSRVHGLCWIIAQETAHNFGLDHEYQWQDDQSSACNDPMTYRADCGGQKFFRNRFAQVGSIGLCGPSSPGNPCLCGTTQNSHQKLLDIFGEGQSTVAAPTVNVVLPANGAALGAQVAASAGSKRGVARVDWYFNGWKWGTSPGAPFGRTGQPVPSTYQFTPPGRLPNGNYDVVAKAYDDLGIETVSATIMATKGAACTDATSCLPGQQCDAGKCFWEQPSAEVGADCTYNEFCKSNLCAGGDNDKICTQSCIPGSADSCPEGLECNPNGNVCFPPDDGGGCCSVGDSDRTFWHAGLSLGVLGLLLGRRRRRK